MLNGRRDEMNEMKDSRGSNISVFTTWCGAWRRRAPEHSGTMADSLALPEGTQVK